MNEGPSLAATLMGAHVSVPLSGRARKVIDGREIVASLAAAAPPTLSETPMPRGVYDRSKKKPAPAASEAPAKPARKKRKAKPGKPGKPAAKPKPAAPRRVVGAARFVVDDRGGMSIEDGQQVIKLERDDVKRLTLFLDRTKAIRT